MLIFRTESLLGRNGTVFGSVLGDEGRKPGVGSGNGREGRTPGVRGKTVEDKSQEEGDVEGTSTSGDSNEGWSNEGRRTKGRREGRIPLPESDLWGRCESPLRWSTARRRRAGRSWGGYR